MGKDLCLLLTGGDAEHLGAAALARPRPSGREAGGISATASVLAVIGHQEDQLARSLALKTASALNVTVCVACGVHLERAGAAEIRQLTEAAHALADAFIQQETAASSPVDRR
jgi:hypothetical protein